MSFQISRKEFKRLVAVACAAKGVRFELNRPE